MDQRDVIDAFLELAVVPSFSRIGPLVRSRLWGWADPADRALGGRTALVTGATGGLGRAAAASLASLGARVILVGRDRGRLDRLRDELVAAHGAGDGAGPAVVEPTDRFPTFVADMTSLEEVRSMAAAIRAAETRLDILVDNAGVIYPERTWTPDGIEASMALMAIGPFVLTAGLLPLLRASQDARVIAVTSGGQYTQPIDVEDLDGRRTGYSGPRFYARAKRAQVTLIREWARRASGSGIAFSSMHPGWARTPGLTDALPGFDRVMGPVLRTPEEGIDTVRWLATTAREDIGGGRLFLDRRARPFDRAPQTRLDARRRRRLWDVVVGRAGIQDPAPDCARSGSRQRPRASLVRGAPAPWLVM